MARHGERIHKRKDGRWEGRYKTGNSENGRTLYSSVYGKSYTEAKQKLNEAENRYSKVQSNITTNKKVFAYAVEQWYITNRYKYKKSTAYKYEYLIEKHILPSLGMLKISSLSAITLNEFADNKLICGSLDGTKGLSKSYVRSMMLIVDSVMKFAAQKGWCSALESEIHKPTPDKKELNILNEKEQIILEKNLMLNLSVTAIGILITLQTGLRIGEICALTWNDFDFENNILYVRSTVSRVKDTERKKGTTLVITTPKTVASVRAIPFSQRLHDILTEMKKCSVSQYVVSEKTGFTNPRTFEYRYHKIMEGLNLPNINYHALRHTFATRCIEHGVDVKTLSEILGHSNVSITLNTYVHSSMELKRIQLEKITSLTA